MVDVKDCEGGAAESMSKREMWSWTPAGLVWTWNKQSFKSSGLTIIYRKKDFRLVFSYCVMIAK